MSDALKEALDAVHTALDNNNVGLDDAIAALKNAIESAGEKTVTMDKTRLPNNSRPGRKMLQTYFKKRGVVVEFAE
jgi:azurin